MEIREMAKAAISRLSESQKIGFKLFVASMGYNTDEEMVNSIELSYSYSDPRDLSIDLIYEDCIINAEDFICNKGKKKSAKEMAKITELVKSAISQMDNLDKFDLLMIEGFKGFTSWKEILNDLTSRFNNWNGLNVDDILGMIQDTTDSINYYYRENDEKTIKKISANSSKLMKIAF